MLTILSTTVCSSDIRLSLNVFLDDSLIISKVHPHLQGLLFTKQQDNTQHRESHIIHGLQHTVIHIPVAITLVTLVPVPYNIRLIFQFLNIFSR